MYDETIHEVEGSLDADMSGTGDVLNFRPSRPVEIIGFGYKVSTALTDAAGGLVLKADKRPTLGSDTGRGDGDLGTLTLTNAQTIAKLAGSVLESRHAAPATPVVPASLTAPQLVYPGEEIVLQLTTAPDGGAGYPFVLVRYKPTADRAVHTVVNA